MPATDIFNRTSEIGAPYRSDQAKLILPSADGADVTLVVQNLNVQYQQQVSRIWEIGSNKQYFVGGRAQGNLQLGTVIGPKPINTALIEKLGDVCGITATGVNAISFEMSNPCETIHADVINLVCSACVLTSIGFRVASADMIVNQDMTVMFAYLKIAVTGGVTVGSNDDTAQ